ncbi:MAG TPA: hypothetical protein VGD65_00330 [Chryseosolibacter sp.]
MKTTLVTLTGLLMVMTSFDTQHDADVAANRMALQVISALHKSSTFHYSALYPPVEAFYQLMDENTALYGSNFEEAKAVFTSEYQNKVIPAMNNSFESLIAQGKKSGIDWRTIKFERVECTAAEHELSFAPVTIVFSANNKEHQLVIDKAIYFQGQWKVSQYLSLK